MRPALLPQPAMVAKFKPAAPRIILPDVRCDLVWAQGRLVVLGPMTRARPALFVGVELTLLSFDPEVAVAWLGLPLKSLTDLQVSFADIAPQRAAVLEEAFAAGVAGRLVAERGPPTSRLGRAVELLRADVSVRRTAAAVNLGERHFSRMFQEALGLNPKAFSRTLRFRRAMIAVADGAPLADAALAAGYADQAHFTRDARAFTGETPRALRPRVGNVQDIVSRVRAD